VAFRAWRRSRLQRRRQDGGQLGNDTRLYRCLDRILPHKTKLEQHLKQRYGELFGAEFDVLLYDLTSTYVEGAAENNPMMRRGYSRDHRPDCEQMVIALIVNSEGFPFSYETFDGNRADVSTIDQSVPGGEAHLCPSDLRHGTVVLNVARPTGLLRRRNCVRTGIPDMNVSGGADGQGTGGSEDIEYVLWSAVDFERDGGSEEQILAVRMRETMRQNPVWSRASHGLLTWLPEAKSWRSATP
jgi:hypothetical protein